MLIVFSVIGYIFYCNLIKNNKIPDDYIAVFYGDSSEITYSTYIYKIKNETENYGFKYINTINTTKSRGNLKVKVSITGKGDIGWTDEVFTVAKNNNAYSYVKLKDGKKHKKDVEKNGIFQQDI